VAFAKTKEMGGIYNFTGSYSNFYDCFQANPQGNVVTNEIFSTIRFMEERLDCSGFCEAPNFWVFKDVRTGPPSSACIFKLKKQYDETAGYIGIAMSLTTLF